MDSIRRHVALALRRLLRAPLFTATAVLTLALGIGANTAIFSVVNGVLLQPLPFEDSDELLSLWHTAPGLGFDELQQSPATYLTYRADSRLLEDVALWNGGGSQVTGLAEPEQVETLMVTDGFLPLLRVEPILGRGFTAEDDAPGAPETVVLTHGYWTRAFGADPGVVGRTITADGRPREIIGVLPEGFDFLDTDPAFLYPARIDPAEVMMGQFSFHAVARMERGATVEAVTAEVERLIPVAAERYPGPVTMSVLEQARFGPLVRPLKEDVVGDIRPVLLVLLGTVAMVLLIASANVANLFLVRAEGRVRDVAVRTALGADRRDIAGQFLTESVLLGLLGGVAGVGLAAAGLELLLALAPGDLPRMDSVGISPVVLAFTAVISVASGLLFGLFPLVRYGRPQLAASLKEGGRGGAQGRERHRARNTLVVAQVALALVLLVGSGLMIRSFQQLRAVDPGFDAPEELMTFRVTIPSAVIEGTDATAEAFRQIEENLETIPGVRAVGAVSGLPLGGWESNDPLFVEGRPVEAGQIPPVRRFQWAMPGYFDAMGIPVLAGRETGWVDVTERRPVVVVSESFALEYWDSPAEALGRRVATLNIEDESRLIWHEIVGVVGDVHADGLDEEAPSTAYWPIVQADLYGRGEQSRRSLAFAVRAEPGVLPTLMPRVREAVWQVSASLPLAQVRTMEALVDRSLARTSFTLVMLGIAGAVALLLGAVGIYGVVSYAVSRRTREIGVRMALGAERGDVSRMVVGEGMLLVGAGVVLGLLGAFGLTRLMASLLYGVEPVDPPTYLAVSAGLALVAAVASWLPARRATRVDPAVTLRQE